MNEGENFLEIKIITKYNNGEIIYQLENGIILKPQYWTGEYYTQGYNRYSGMCNEYRYIPIYDKKAENLIIGFKEQYRKEE